MKRKMMKIVFSLICMQYFGSINKINLNSYLKKFFSVTQCKFGKRDNKCSVGDPDPDQ
jgi:hypothetical protein